MRAVITGGSSGLGLELKRRFWDADWDVLDWSLETGVNVANRRDVEKAAFKASASLSGVELLINCAGANHLDWIENLCDDHWDTVLGANAKSIFLTSQQLLPLMKGGTIVNIVSNAADMPMTHSLLYNASKGAAKAMTMQMARELRQSHDITVFGVSPNKMSGTGMSDAVDRRAAELRGCSLEEAQAYQRSRLPFGEETPVGEVADFIFWLTSEKTRHRHCAGTIIPFGL